MICYVINTYTNLFRDNNYIYTYKNTIEAIKLDNIAQYYIDTNVLMKLNGNNFSYRLLNDSGLDSNNIALILDIPDDIEIIHRMSYDITERNYKSDYERLLLTDIKIEWVKQSIDFQELMNITDDYYNVTFYEHGSLKLEYNKDINFKNELLNIVNKTHEEDLSIEDLIQYSIEIDNIIERNKDKAPSEIINTLIDITSESIDNINYDDINVYESVFNEYYWNLYFREHKFNVINKIELKN